MIITPETSCTVQPSLGELIESLPQFPRDHSFGADIDEAHAVLLDDSLGMDEKQDAFMKWAAKYQPCLFGRLAAKEQRSMAMDMCFISADELFQGEEYLRLRIQNMRRAWKDRTATGASHGLLILFNAPQLARARPSRELATVLKRLGGLYLVEFAPIESWVVYNEAMPLRDREGHLSLFKAAITFFYSGAHRTRNHDRRIPGGFMLSTNSPGHYANSLVTRGLVDSLQQAVTQVRDITWRSIGNGGIGDDRVGSTSWHNVDPNRAESECPMANRPKYIPAQFDTKTYSAYYHTDVLVPEDVNIDPGQLADMTKRPEVWKWLLIDYVTDERRPYDHPNYGQFHGHLIEEGAMYHNPWPPVRASNDSNANY